MVLCIWTHCLVDVWDYSDFLKFSNKTSESSITVSATALQNFKNRSRGWLLRTVSHLFIKRHSTWIRCGMIRDVNLCYTIKPQDSSLYFLQINCILTQCVPKWSVYSCWSFSTLVINRPDISFVAGRWNNQFTDSHLSSENLWPILLINCVHS